MRMFLVRAVGFVALALGIGADGVMGQEQLITNGNFAANGGSLAGWTAVTEAGSAPDSGWFLQPGTSTTSPITGYTVPTMGAGTFAAIQDESGDSSSILYTDITIPNIPIVSATLSFDVFVGNRAGYYATQPTLDFSVTPNQQFRIDFETPSSNQFNLNNVLLNVFQTEPGDPLVYPGFESFSMNVTAFVQSEAGMTVVLANSGVNNVYFMQEMVTDFSLIIQTVPEPSGLVLAAVGGGVMVVFIQSGFIRKSRRRTAR